MRIAILVCACAVALAASKTIFVPDASAQILPIVMGGAGPSGGVSVGEMKPSDPLSPPGRDPAEQSARSIECAQKADAQGLQGENRKRFLRKCRSGA